LEWFIPPVDLKNDGGEAKPEPNATVNPAKVISDLAVVESSLRLDN